MDVRIVVEDHAGIEQALWVEQPLDAPHQLGRLPPPFHLDERGHVAARAVLGLERAVVATDDDAGDLVHQVGIALDRFRIGKALGKYKVQIAVECVAENDGFRVAVFDESGLQIGGRGGEVRDRHRHVFDDHRRPDRAHRADRRKQALADLPVLVDQIGIGRKFHRSRGRRHR